MLVKLIFWCLVILIWKDGLERIYGMKFSYEEIWRDEIGNYKTVFVSELKIRKYPFSHGSISNFTNISIKKIKNL